MENICNFNQLDQETKIYDSLNSLDGNLKKAYVDIMKILKFVECIKKNRIGKSPAEMAIIDGQIGKLARRIVAIAKLISKTENVTTNTKQFIEIPTIGKNVNTNIHKNLNVEPCEDYWQLDYDTELYSLSHDQHYDMEQTNDHLDRVTKFIECTENQKINKPKNEMAEMNEQIQDMKKRESDIKKLIDLNSNKQKGGNGDYYDKYVKYKMKYLSSR